MKASHVLFQEIAKGVHNERLRQLYGDAPGTLARQRERYCDALLAFEKYYGPGRPVDIFSVPGRTELGGNNTDHQHGVALAAAVDLDIIAVASPCRAPLIRVKSYGFNKLDVVDLSISQPVESESTHSASLIRGIAGELARRGGHVGGFDAYTASDVLRGSGLSSSAAFEVMIVTILNHTYNGGRMSALELAEISQYAENRYFGKPSGLLDPLSCAMGGTIYVDFAAARTPEIRALRLEMQKTGYRLCVTDTRGSHSELTAEFAAIRQEMEAVSHYFGHQTLREVQEQEVMRSLPEVRAACGDRAVLRALHFFGECRRVFQEYDCLKRGDFEGFLQLQRESGRSSIQYGQNAYCADRPGEQPLLIALALSASVLKERGAARLQGTGFAGTIQAFVPESRIAEYQSAVSGVFGEGSCLLLAIRNMGSTRVMG